jgi:hypothetical protein
MRWAACHSRSCHFCHCRFNRSKAVKSEATMLQPNQTPDGKLRTPPPQSSGVQHKHQQADAAAAEMHCRALYSCLVPLRRLRHYGRLTQLTVCAQQHTGLLQQWRLTRHRSSRSCHGCHCNHKGAAYSCWNGNHKAHITPNSCKRLSSTRHLCLRVQRPRIVYEACSNSEAGRCARLE